MDDNDTIYSTTDAPERRPYVPKARPRKTQEAINDLAEDETFATEFTHDSNVTVGSRNPLSGRAYNRSRGGVAQLQRDLHYGQYLEIPKGRRDIFRRKERLHNFGAILAAIVVLAAVAGAAYFVVMYLQGMFG